MAEISKKDLEDAVYSAFKRINSGGGFSGGSSGGGGGGTSSTPSSGADAFIKGLGSAATNVKEFGTKIYEGGKEYIGVFRNLSNAGTNFSNDIVKIGVAAADSRLSLGEFSDVIKENGKNLAGLGGSVTRGAEAFSKLSKEFFDSRATDELQQLGYSSKELNDVLAIQMSTQRSTFQNDEAGRKKALQAAASLAQEMDMLSKLTGKTRDEQMKEAQKRATDGQIEAKLRLIGIEQGAEAEAKARAGFQQQMAQAEARGMGQMAKEMFATGTLTSEEAATQYALLGEAAQKTGEQMGHLAKGNVEAAEAASKQADAANARNQRDPNLLRLATFGDAAGAAGSAMKQNVEANQALHDSVMAAAKGMKPGLTNSVDSFGKALDIVRDQIKSSSKGLDEAGKQVSGVTRAAVQGGIQAREIKAGAARSADAAIGTQARDAGIASEKYMSQNPYTATGIEDRTKKGLNPQDAGQYATPSEKREAQGGIVGAIASGSSTIANMGVKVLKADKIEGLQGRQTGSLGEAGKLIEDFGKGTLTMLHGREGVVTESQMMDLAKGLKSDGVRSAVNQLKSSMPTENADQDQFKELGNLFKTAMPGNIGAGKSANKPIDISSVVKQLQTSISDSNLNKGFDIKNMIDQSATDSTDTASIDSLTATLNSHTDLLEKDSNTQSKNLDVKSIFESFKSNLNSTISPALADLQQLGTSESNKTNTAEESKKSEKTENIQSTVQKDATLKDVVSSLDRLNMMMGQMLAQQQDIGAKQIRAAKTAGSLNLYDNL
jgi:hypothetical protein